MHQAPQSSQRYTIMRQPHIICLIESVSFSFNIQNNEVTAIQRHHKSQMTGSMESRANTHCDHTIKPSRILQRPRTVEE